MNKITFKHKIFQIILILVITIIIFLIPNLYSYYNELNSQIIETELSKIIESGDDLTNKLNKLDEEYDFKVIVEKDDYLYSSIGLNATESNNLLLDDDYRVYIDTINGYYVYLATPNISPQGFFVIYSILLIFALLVMLILSIYINKQTEKLFLNPLLNVSDNLDSLAKLDIDNLQNKNKDVINKQLVSFGTNVLEILNDNEKYISTVSKNEQLNDYLKERQVEYLSTVIHDNKTEYQQIIYELSDDRDKNKKVIEKLSKLNKEANDILNNLYNERDYLQIINEVDVSEVIEDIIHKTIILQDDYDVSILKTGKSFILNTNVVLFSQLIFNLVTNAIKNSEINNQVEIKLVSQRIEISNYTNKKLDINNIFSLNLNESSDGGFGLYRIKNISNELNLKLDVTLEDNIITFIVEEDNE